MNDDRPSSPADPPKAYEDLAFLRSSQARSIRVLAELLEPQYRLAKHGIADTIVFFGSARVPADPAATDHPGLQRLAPYYAAARTLAARITRWNQDRPGGRQWVVCSGGGPGLMEAANRGAAEAGGPTVGLGISIPAEQEINPWVTPGLAFDFHYFFVRKFWFVYNAKVLVCFPGGFGTMDELMEVLTLVQTRKVHKPLGIVLYGRDFWESVLHFDAMVEWGVITPEDRDLVTIVDSVDEAFAQIQGFLERSYGATLLREDPLDRAGSV